MSNIDTAIGTLADRLREHSETIETEEAVKTSVILPFLQALGYDVFNPAEVVPEFTADVPGKKGEKVDYAIQRANEVQILIECKGLNTQLTEKHLAQLYRYFTVTNARFAILTNGKEWQFYSDLEEPNRLDRRPFLIFDLLDHNKAGLEELQKFARNDFDIDKILAQAERLKYVAAVKKVLSGWIEEAPDELVKLVGSQVYDGRITAQVREMLAKATKSAFREIVNDGVRSRLSSALRDPDADQSVNAEDVSDDSGIETTEEEIEGYLIIKSILRETTDAERVHMRDAKSYCAVLLDNNNRKPIARLHFNRKQKYLGLFDGDAEERIPIDGLNAIFEFKDRIAGTANKYD